MTETDPAQLLSKVPRKSVSTGKHLAGGAQGPVAVTLSGSVRGARTLESEAVRLNVPLPMKDPVDNPGIDEGLIFPLAIDD